MLVGGDSIWASIILGELKKEAGFAGWWVHLFGVAGLSGLEVVMYGEGWGELMGTIWL